MKTAKKIIVLMLAALLLASCAPQTAAEQPAASTEQAAASTALVSQLITEDPAGNPIKIPDTIEKIVSLAPSVTELLIELGYADKLVAVDTQSQNIAGLPENLEYFDLLSPDAEVLTAMKPDIIYASAISLKGGGNDVLSPLKEFGITVAYIPSSESIDRIYKDIEFVAGTLNNKAEGDRIIGEMKTRIAEIQEIASKVPEKKSVYFEISAAPYMYSFGAGVYLNEMIEIIGAENALADQTGWISVSEESILGSNPDVIFTNVNYVENPVEEIKARAGWDAVTAVKDNQVYYIDNSASSLPNHNIVKALEEMMAAVYPGLL